MDDEIGQKIREIRAQKGLAQKEVAERYGMADSVIGKYELGTVTPKYGTLEGAGLALGVEPYWLITGIATADKLGQMASKMLTLLREYKTKLSELEEAVKAVLPDSYDKLSVGGKDRAIQQAQGLTKIPGH